MLKRAKDDLDECEKTLKVTVIALGKAAEEAETFVKATYQYELQSVMENPSSAADEVQTVESNVGTHRFLCLVIIVLMRRRPCSL